MQIHHTPLEVWGGHADLSEFIVVWVDIVKALHQVTSGPHNAAGVEGVEELHGDSGARHRLDIDRHRRLVCRQTDGQRWVKSKSILPILSSR